MQRFADQSGGHGDTTRGKAVPVRLCEWQPCWGLLSDLLCAY